MLLDGQHLRTDTSSADMSYASLQTDCPMQASERYQYLAEYRPGQK